MYKFRPDVSFIFMLCAIFIKNVSCSSKPDDFSTDLNAIRVKYNLPGLSALVLRKGEIVGQGAAGYRRQGYPTPLLPTDLLNLGSNSKWMTATLAGRLVDKKVLSWTTQVHECFSNYKDFNSGFANATLEQFLADRSGVQQTTTFFSRHYQHLLNQQGTFQQIRLWVAETVMKDAPEVPNGEFLYANQGYAVAAAMMEKLTGLDWESLIQEHVFTPLKMSSATIGAVYDDIIPPNTPVGHDLNANFTEPVSWPVGSPVLLLNDQAATGPAGYVACTLQDWVKFLYAHITGERTGYLSAESAAKLKRPFIRNEGYGLGVWVYNHPLAKPGQALHYLGYIFGQNTVFWMSPARDLIIAAYTNCRSDMQPSPTSLALDDTVKMLTIKYYQHSNIIFER